MATYRTYSTANYVKSENIKVFPCAYRGYFQTDGTGDGTVGLVFDPEARATTEANFTNTFHKLSPTKESYVISWDSSTLKCVIGGYYFEIYRHTQVDDWFEVSESEGFKTYIPKYLCIKTEPAALSRSVIDDGTYTSGAGIDSDRETYVLGSFIESTNYLDVRLDGDYLFTGLTIQTAAEIENKNNLITLAPFIPGFTYANIPDSTTIYFNSETFNGWVKNENTSYGANGSYLYIDANGDMVPLTKNLNDLIAAGKVKAPAEGTSLYTYDRTMYIKVNPAMYPITKLLDTAKGEYAIGQLGGPEYVEGAVAYYNNTTATGAYAVALGKHTKATGNASVAFGDNTEAHGIGTFAAGTRTKALKGGAVAFGSNSVAGGRGAVAFGTNTNAKADGAVTFGNTTTAAGVNQVVLGKYNIEDAEKALIIGNGDDTSNRANILTVSYNGDLKVSGNFEVNGNTGTSPAIASIGGGANDLVLGTSSAGSKGSISVYGNSSTKVFEVTDAGVTNIANNTTISGITTITNTTNSDSSTTGALVVHGGLGLKKALNVEGAATIGGATTLNSTLTVTGAATLNNSLTVNSKATFTGDVEIVNNKQLTVAGGTTLKDNVTLEKDLTISGTAKISGTAEIGSNTAILSTTPASGTSAALTVKGGSIVDKNLIIKGETQADSTATGAVVIKGGVGIAKNVYIGGQTESAGKVTVKNDLQVDNVSTFKGDTTISSTTDYSKNAGGKVTAALSVSGGAYIAKKLHVEGNTTFYDNLEITSDRVAIKKTTASTSANSGALVVNGGVGIGGSLNATGDVAFAQNLTLANSSNKANTLQIGNESTANKGGNLIIYGSGTASIFEVDNKGETYIAGSLEVDGEIKANKKLTVDKAIEISASGITGLTGLTVSGQVNATVFNATSDARVKCNIEDYKFKKSILDLPIKQFEYTNDTTHKKYIGCIAQDLQQICPELVNETEDGILTIQESKLVYVLLQEIKELKNKIEQLERR